MAHFARISGQHVDTVIVVANEDIIDADGNENEAIGIELATQLAGDGVWVQTSYNGSFRRRYAGYQPGMTYSAEHDAFILPKPFESWVLNLDDPNDWVAPIPQPSDPCENGVWLWNEGDEAWVCTPIVTPEQP